MEQKLIEALQQISVALKNIQWDAICNGTTSNNTVMANKAIDCLDEIINEANLNPDSFTEVTP